MTRVRFGLTGLAFVFLLVLSAAALLGNLPEGRLQPTGGEDPLATLGVAPGIEHPRENPVPLEPPRAEAPPLGEEELAPLPPFDPELAEDPLDSIPQPSDGTSDEKSGRELVEI
ncbi:hypothetical protein B5C34_10430 [Pacificimonas flava]|uniref:Uncharacterized protein n=2 Tax=Pacificimonas TaxID=1960290 RepID=A0A219B6M7_9SPHN|nr:MULTISPECIES: hypothetical protein [Pacificimonas]MBZ6378915.1 hypothetical protein [Pacificimonas aurantium]OWV33834.1 hypothetical protein B5C34_10430 [Pacificimonas flava]